VAGGTESSVPPGWSQLRTLDRQRRFSAKNRTSANNAPTGEHFQYPQPIRGKAGEGEPLPEYWVQQGAIPP
jgi:hypothetical protein